MPFSETTYRSGMVQKLEDLTHTQSDDASSGSYNINAMTRDLNSARDAFKNIVIEACGEWQDDDTNQTDYSISTFDLVSGQDNYAFTNDENGNQILSVLKIRLKDPNGKYKDLKQIDRTTFDINAYQDITGTPEYYDLTSNGAIMYPTPDYNSTNGVEIYHSRTYTYYETTDTTKKSGLPAIFDLWFPFYAAYHYCLINIPSLAVGYRNFLYGEDGRSGMKKDIQRHYANRNKTSTMIITTEDVNSI